MHIPKSKYEIKSSYHGTGKIKNVILDETHLPHLLQFAKSYFRKGQSLKAHNHVSMAEVFYIASGTVKVVEGDKSYIAKEGDSFYIRAKVIHSFDFIENTEMIYFNLEDHN
ncbi:MAG: cupin domain-containing protein [Melioribacteraceae bacterium]|nr:cupin domain-containing protein [Melioribacteraceae bacterium]MCF8396398.1 cupin domain-containing protein [Melioribacteraceae bacterium]